MSNLRLTSSTLLVLLVPPKLPPLIEPKLSELAPPNWLPDRIEDKESASTITVLVPPPKLASKLTCKIKVV